MCDDARPRGKRSPAATTTPTSRDGAPHGSSTELQEKAAREKKADPTTKDTGTTTKLWVTIGGTTAFLSVGIYSLMADPNESDLARSAQSTSLGKWLTANVGEMASTFVNPCREKLLPDWPPDYLGHIDHAHRAPTLSS